MTRNATYLEAGLAVLLLAGGFGWALEHMTRRDDATLATLHTHTVVTKAIAGEAESVYVKDTLPIKAARDSLRRLRDSVLAHPADTVRVKEYVAQADRTIALDSTALAAASATIHDLHAVVDAQDAELHEAMKPVYAPRLTATVAALYDPVAGQPLASAGVSLRVIGRLALVGRIDQRAALGERPQLAAGFSFSF